MLNFIVFNVILLFAGFVGILVFSLGVVACLAPLKSFRDGENPPRTAVLILVGVAAIFQIYFWGFWSAFCVATTLKFTQKPEVTWDWLYWLAGFAESVSLIGWLAHKEPGSSKGTGFYSLIAIVAFLVFAFAPSLMLPPYGWALKPLGFQTVQEDPGRVACRDAIMSFIEAQGMMSDERGNVVQLSKAQEEQLKQRIRQGLSSAAQVPDHFLDSIHPELRSEFAGHLVLGWQLYLEGLERNDPARQIAGIKNLQRWQEFKDANVDLLYQRIIE